MFRRLPRPLADFHALHKTFITNLSKSGVSPKLAQCLSRHSDIKLTMNFYTDVVLEDQSVAVDLLPELPALVPSPKPIHPPGIDLHLAKIRERAAQNKVVKWSGEYLRMFVQNLVINCSTDFWVTVLRCIPDALSPTTIVTTSGRL